MLYPVQWHHPMRCAYAVYSQTNMWSISFNVRANINKRFMIGHALLRLYVDNELEMLIFAVGKAIVNILYLVLIGTIYPNNTIRDRIVEVILHKVVSDECRRFGRYTSI